LLFIFRYSVNHWKVNTSKHTLQISKDIKIKCEDLKMGARLVHLKSELTKELENIFENPRNLWEKA
jgi:hypothetical protein